ncbi:GGDEF domain-containing protein [Pseudobacteriovorax antillogorgiicola]|uniref:diguanylate cyclase n=1 Tax=Pseudobacteriovorax antillogorgiicola TaxID=1513793 RepID=A0A1Y6C7N7_9BACT|nr:GGDEF domain-containing protein [Pseudobacteriovorax antillogorgiicola]TCS50730.1 diguanylate cyclase (GGDEF)-like protein [Pseudobacteriovorax antillogorgiicola]SMF40914.1 diguanylate cyclase (GGDEF) domain-containing protein [Pseudobacteriovorax antillogorgiicola]
MGKDALGKALIVANSAENLMCYNQILRRTFKTKNSPTFDSTLDLLDDFEPDVIIIDEIIFKSSALEISQAIRSDTVAKHYQGIVIIAEPKTPDLENLKRESGADYVIRQSHVNDILEMIALSALRVKDLENTSQALITKLAMTKEMVKELEGQDSITRLYNLPYINLLLEKEFVRTIRFNAPLSAVIISIDQFIQISHTEGPKVCIKIIQQLGEVLKNEFRDDDKLGRSWGGEFVGILPETDHEGAMILARRIKNMVAERQYGPEENKRTITISQGIGSFNPMRPVISDIHDLLLEAESNLSEAKKIGVNLICYQKNTA